MVFAGSDKDKGICAKILTVPKAVVHPDRLEVVFKAGVTVEVALSTPNRSKK